jgi:hypothetical protein
MQSARPILKIESSKMGVVVLDKQLIESGENLVSPTFDREINASSLRFTMIF